MTELELYKFVEDNNIEWHYNWDKSEVILFINIYLLDDFNKMLAKDSIIMDEAGIE